MNNIEYILSVIKRKIPLPILNMAFLPTDTFGRLRPSLSHCIQNTIVNNWVLADANMVAGIETIIDITNCQITTVNMGMIIHVGLGPTAGKVITSVLSVGYGYNALAGGQPGIASALTEPLQTSDARVQLVGTNIVYVEGYTGVTLTNMRCVLENDEEFNNLSPRAMPFISELCTLAAKAYIYNELSIKLANAVIVNGIDTGKYAEIVNSYSDADQMYTEQRDTKLAKITLLSDPVTRNRIIRMTCPS